MVHRLAHRKTIVYRLKLSAFYGNRRAAACSALGKFRFPVNNETFACATADHSGRPLDRPSGNSPIY